MNSNKKKLIIISLIFNLSNAEYSVVVPLEQSNGGSLENGTINFKASENWVSTTPLYTNWVNNGNLYDCNNWSPLENTINIGISFEQTATDCKQDQTRTRQDREQETTTLVYRDVGSIIEENQTLFNQINTRNAVGTKETWVAATPVYTSWTNSGGIYGCSNWSPDPSTVTSGQTFTQTATDCEQDQTRTRQNREQETTTLVYRDVGGLITENQTLYNQTNYRSAIGTKINKTCTYDSNNYVIIYLSNYWAYNDVIWNGVSMKGAGISILIPYTANGFTYDKGDFVKRITKTDYYGTETSDYYYVCRY